MKSANNWKYIYNYTTVIPTKMAATTQVNIIKSTIKYSTINYRQCTRVNRQLKSTMDKVNYTRRKLKSDNDEVPRKVNRSQTGVGVGMVAPPPAAPQLQAASKSIKQRRKPTFNERNRQSTINIYRQSPTIADSQR